MHPLEKEIEDDERERKPPPRRRSSLDCIASLQDEREKQLHGEEEVEKPRERRFSLGHGKLVPTTFLATSSRRLKEDLDDELHASAHNLFADGGHDMLRNPSRHSVATPSTSFEDEGSMSSSFDDDCDSFCDAETEEKANKEYLRKDLGASFYFTDESCDGYEGVRERLSDDGFGSISEDKPAEHALPQKLRPEEIFTRQQRRAGRRSNTKSPKGNDTKKVQNVEDMNSSYY